VSPLGGRARRPCARQSCGDLDVCNGLETCQSGTCVAGTAPLCDEGNPCTTEGCDSSTGCTHAPVDGFCVSDADCADGDACTVNERCVGGHCTSDARNCHLGVEALADPASLRFRRTRDRKGAGWRRRRPPCPELPPRRASRCGPSSAAAGPSTFGSGS